MDVFERAFILGLLAWMQTPMMVKAGSSAHPEAMETHPGAMESHPGAMKAHHRAAKAQLKPCWLTL
jgi:hypothetical protein